ncbi:MAG: sodium:solute symporter [Victivallaceae bacterium]
MIDYIIIAVYMLGVVALGILASNSNRSFREFAVADAGFGPVLLLATLSASFIGGGFSLGNAAKVYSNGIYYSFMLLGFSLQILLISLFLAPRAHRFAGAMSVGDILERKYGRSSRIAGGVLSFLSCAGILGAQIGGMGAILEVLTGIPYIWGALLGCVVILFYSTVGGIRAVVWTDAVQFALLAVAIPLVLVLGIVKAGGWSAIVAKLPPEKLAIFPDSVPATALISLFLVFLLGEALVPPYVQRLLISRDRRHLFWGTFGSGLLSGPFFLIAGGIGLVAIVLLPTIDPNTAFPAMVKLLAPPGVRGLIIAGVMAIVMSSADSFLLCASVAVVQDIYRPLSKKRNDEAVKLKIARTANILTGAAALVFVLYIPNVLDVLIFAYNFWAPLVLVPLTAALLDLKVRKISFAAGLLAGLAGSLLWNRFFRTAIPLDGIVVGVLCNLLAFTAANLIPSPGHRVKSPAIQNLNN